MDKWLIAAAVSVDGAGARLEQIGAAEEVLLWWCLGRLGRNVADTAR